MQTTTPNPPPGFFLIFIFIIFYSDPYNSYLVVYVHSKTKEEREHYKVIQLNTLSFQVPGDVLMKKRSPAKISAGLFPAQRGEGMMLRAKID